jgi:preprotein translocase subunit YajC
MTIHGLSFILFIISIVILDVFYFFYITSDDENEHQTIRNSLIAWILTVYTNFIAQLFLIMIFLKFRSNKQPKKENKLNCEN